MTTGFVTRDDLHKCLGASVSSRKQKGRIFVIGDSHAFAYSPGIIHAFPDWTSEHIPLGGNVLTYHIERQLKTAKNTTLTALII